MLKIGMIAFAILGITAMNTQAQPGDKPHHGHGMPDSCHIQKMVDDLAVVLVLTDQQKQQITTISYAHMQEVKALHEKDKNNCEGNKEAHDQLRQKMDTDIKAVLNKDQQAKYDEFMKEKRGPQCKHHGDMKNPPAEK